MREVNTQCLTISTLLAAAAAAAAGDDDAGTNCYNEKTSTADRTARACVCVCVWPAATLRYVASPSFSCTQHVVSAETPRDGTYTVVAACSSQCVCIISAISTSLHADAKNYANHSPTCLSIHAYRPIRYMTYTSAAVSV